MAHKGRPRTFRIPVHERILARTEKVTESGCWIWMGALNGNGYSKIATHTGPKIKRMRLCHRLMYEHLRGAIPFGLTLDHLCRVRCCVNPWHLEPVTHRENVLRGASVLAANARKAACPKCGGPYSVLPDMSWRLGGRCCRPCTATRKARYRRSRAAKRLSQEVLLGASA